MPRPTRSSRVLSSQQTERVSAGPQSAARKKKSAKKKAPAASEQKKSVRKKPRTAAEKSTPEVSEPLTQTAQKTGSRAAKKNAKKTAKKTSPKTTRQETGNGSLASLRTTPASKRKTRQQPVQESVGVIESTAQPVAEGNGPSAPNTIGSTHSEIVIRGAREHNLRDVSLTLPKQRLIVMTGVSGSGKSSLAFDTLYAEGQRRYIESLSTYARQFLGQLPKPNVDFVSGLAPCISIQQKMTGRNPRSTVGTITEVYDYLRILFARVGQGYCHVSGLPIQAQTTDQIVETILRTPAGTQLQILAPLVQQQKGEFRDLFEDLLKQGYLRVRVDGKVYQLTEPPTLRKNFKHTIEVLIDRLEVGKMGRTRLTEAVELALKLGQQGLIVLESRDGEEPLERYYSARYACPESGMSYEPPSPQLFSFNSPIGMCPDCNGLGERFDFDIDLLVAEPELSLNKGAIPLLGPFKEMGRHKKLKYLNLTNVVEGLARLKRGTVLRTKWSKLSEEARQLMLYGTASIDDDEYFKRIKSRYRIRVEHRGLVGDLLESYRTAGNPMRRRQLEKYMKTSVCGTCGGTRLNKQARHVRITSASPGFRATHEKWELNLPEICALTIAECYEFFEALELTDTQRLIAEDALKEIRGRLGFLLQCGLDYLSLDRTAPTLSGGESQRIRLAGQIGSGLSGIVYILDEPSIGLHPRDNDLLLGSLLRLRDMGNTVVVVEHDEVTMQAADHIVDFGPGPGHRGGEIVAQGRLEEIQECDRSITGQYLSGKRRIEIPKKRREPNERRLRVVGARHNNLKNIDVEIPLGCFVCVTGVSGSGKSSLTNDILWQVLNRDVNKGNGSPGLHERIEGLDLIDKTIDIDQSPIGRTPRSNPATYVKVFDLIRDLFTQLPAAKVRGYKPGRFSFNVAEGRCEACEGHGATKLDMDFLADMWVTCPVCEGKRFRKETLEIEYRGYNIADILDLEIGDALPLFDSHPKIQRILQTLHDVGLDYLRLGQPSPTLSGGEAQRVKLARELGKRSTGRTVYLLDEPTTGLHFEDVRKLLEVLHKFCEQGNTVVVIEHHLDVIKTADWVIDIGPEGGAAGGEVVVAGTPETVANCAASHTGRALRDVLPAKSLKPLVLPADSAAVVVPADSSGNRTVPKRAGKKSKRSANVETPPLIISARVTTEPGNRQDLADIARQISIRGARQHNLQDVDLIIPRNSINVFSGPSGSGKTSLAMDTLYAEGQRRYVESLSAYARQFLGQMPKPKVTQIQGLSPSIAIEQKTVGSTPRSTVGTVTEIYDYLRVLYARLGQLYCPSCDVPVTQSTVDEIVDKVVQFPEGTRALLLAAVSLPQGDTYTDFWQSLKQQGYSRVRIDGVTHHLDDPPELDYKSQHRVEIVVDRLRLSDGKTERARIAESLELALDIGKGHVSLALVDADRGETEWEQHGYSVHLSCHACGLAFEHLTPQNFSFNSPLGWCRTCEGLGVEQGVRQAALISDSSLSLREGAIAVWPNPQENPRILQYLEAISAGCDIPLDVPFARLSARQQQLLYHGTDTLLPVPGQPGLTIVFKGLLPTLREAPRLSYDIRRALLEQMGEQHCGTCGGTRLREDSAHVRLNNLTLPQLCNLPLVDALAALEGLPLDAEQSRIAGDLVAEATHRLRFLVEVGLDYLSLDRGMPTLSGGESQRIRLAGQLGRALTGVLYVLDEPTIGLHPRDNHRLISALRKLRDLGNTVLLVEHDRDIIAASDNIYDFGPAAGRLGGHVVAQGSPQELQTQETSLTGNYLSGRLEIPVPVARRISAELMAMAGSTTTPGNASEVQDVYYEPIEEEGYYDDEEDEAIIVEDLIARLQSEKLTVEQVMDVIQEEKLKRQRSRSQSRKAALHGSGNPGRQQTGSHDPSGKWLELKGVRHHNLRNVDLRLPLSAMTCVTGVSGSGKSSLIMDTLAEAARKRVHFTGNQPGLHTSLEGIEGIRKVVVVDQQPIGNTPASCPATYVGVFDQIRELYARLPEAKRRGFRPGRFSFNVQGGRCEECQGLGQICIEMHFLPDVWVECSACGGKRFNKETLEVCYKGHSISDVLNMSIHQAAELFADQPKIHPALQVMCEIGLDYLTLGQSAPTLSGGESQRIKLAAELARPNSGKTLYILDEPTTGLHVDDISKLLKVLNGLIDLGNTVVIVEHNLDVVKTADWIVDVGPEAGRGGGWIVAQGSPEQVVAEACRLREHEEYCDGDRKQRKRSWTGELLEPLLHSSARVERETLSLKDLRANSPRQLSQQEVSAQSGSVTTQGQPCWEVPGIESHLNQEMLRKRRNVRWLPNVLKSLLEQLGTYPLLFDAEDPKYIFLGCQPGLHPELPKFGDGQTMLGYITTNNPHGVELSLHWPSALSPSTDLLKDADNPFKRHPYPESHYDILYTQFTRVAHTENPVLQRVLNELCYSS